MHSQFVTNKCGAKKIWNEDENNNLSVKWDGFAKQLLTNVTLQKTFHPSAKMSLDGLEHLNNDNRNFKFQWWWKYHPNLQFPWLSCRIERGWKIPKIEDYMSATRFSKYDEEGLKTVDWDENNTLSIKWLITSLDI